MLDVILYLRCSENWRSTYSIIIKWTTKCTLMGPNNYTTAQPRGDWDGAAREGRGGPGSWKQNQGGVCWLPEGQGEWGPAQPRFSRAAASVTCVIKHLETEVLYSNTERPTFQQDSWKQNEWGESNTHGPSLCGSWNPITWSFFFHKYTQRRHISSTIKNG